MNDNDCKRYEILFEDRHWNHNAACFIPAAYVACFQCGMRWPCGTSYDEARKSVAREFPGAVCLSDKYLKYENHSK